MSRPSTTRIEMPFHLEERELFITGDVTLGARWPRVDNFACIDARTADELELPDWALDQAEHELVLEAERMWRSP